jgi:hypothetical protein
MLNPLQLVVSVGIDYRTRSNKCLMRPHKIYIVHAEPATLAHTQCPTKFTTFQNAVVARYEIVLKTSQSYKYNHVRFNGL